MGGAHKIMNKVIAIGRLTRDPDIRYSSAAEPLAIARYSIACNKRFKREGEPDAEFINCVSFGKQAEFMEKYFKKGMQIAIVGRLQTKSYEDKDGIKRFSTEVVVDEQEFTESKASFESRGQGGSGGSYSSPKQSGSSGSSSSSSSSSSYHQPPHQEDSFSSILQDINEDDLPF
jgi:single-strand DNA-binding protein